MSTQDSYRRSVTCAGLCWAVLNLLWGAVSPTMADPPIEALEAPVFSFDLGSPKVAAGMVRGDTLLKPAPPNLETVVEGWAFGLGLYDDDVDAISTANSSHAFAATFTLLFSVDSESVGVAAPDPDWVALGVPYNVLDQAARGHAAGDEFMSTTLFSLDSTVSVTAAILPWNNVLLRNNFDEGGTDFIADPPTSAETLVVNVLQDNVDALAVVQSVGEGIYFSITKDSPSLSGLHGGPSPSAADVFVFTPGAPREASPNPPGVQTRAAGAQPCQATCCQLANELYEDCLALGGTIEDCAAQAHDELRTCLQEVCGITPEPPPGLYASAIELGLRQGDDIDGLIVFDVNLSGVFDGTDRVLFSLTKTSPSLETIAGASPTGAGADVFLMSPDLEEPVLFASAGTLGLGDENDELDALDFEPCDESLSCAALHGIRVHASIPAVSSWGMAIMLLLLLIAATLTVLRRLPQQP